MDLQARVHLVDEPYGAQVLDDGGVDAAVDAPPEMMQRVTQLGGFEEDVEGEIDAGAMGMRQEAGLLEVIQSQLRAFVPGIELFHAEVDRVGAVAEGGTNGVETPGGGEQFGDGASHEGKLIPPERVGLGIPVGAHEAQTPEDAPDLLGLRPPGVGLEAGRI